jgi:hypothetical protein
MSRARTVAAVAVITALLPSACGGEDDSTTEAAREQSTPAKAIAEIDETSSGLDQAVQQLQAGDTKAAKETVAETYLQHFEEVEGPLGDVDPELNEKLEEAISTELRADIGKESVKNIKARVEELKAELATAKQKLEQ